MTGSADVLRTLLAGSADLRPIDSIEAWWQRHRARGALLAPGAPPVDLALLGGFDADRLGYAFASGYHAALRALVPALGADALAALCATEKGGAHPRAIETRLAPDGAGGFVVTGQKRWATLSTRAHELLVVASTGADLAGKNRLRVARVPVTRSGVTLRPMPETPFAPEIRHAEVDLEGVAVAAAEILPGDGYDRYLKPFRTIEDVHVHAAVLGHAIAIARRRGWPREIVQRLAALVAGLRAIALEPPDAPAIHVALAGAIDATAATLEAAEPLWSSAEDEERTRWVRDAPLLRVAGSARGQRAESAWARLRDAP